MLQSKARLQQQRTTCKRERNYPENSSTLNQKRLKRQQKPLD